MSPQTTQQPMQPAKPVAQPMGGKTSVLAILGLIFAFLFPLVGLILSIIAMVQIKKDPNLKGKGLALAGLIVSIVFIVLGLILFLTGVATFMSVARAA